jgi:hypothetical protein
VLGGSCGPSRPSSLADAADMRHVPAGSTRGLPGRVVIPLSRQRFCTTLTGPRRGITTASIVAASSLVSCTFAVDDGGQRPAFLVDEDLSLQPDATKPCPTTVLGRFLSAAQPTGFLGCANVITQRAKKILLRNNTKLTIAMASTVAK